MFGRSRIPRCFVLMAAFFFLVDGACIAQDQQDSSEAISPYRADLESLAARILKRADKANCRPNSCTVLVANFTNPSGSTSRFSIQLADSVSVELLAQGNGIQIVDRSRLLDYLTREHIASNALNDREAARWLATEFQANAVLIGNIEQLGDHFNLLVELLNISTDKVGPQETMQIAIPEPQKAFAPFEPYEAERSGPAVSATQGSTLPRAGVNGVGVPECVYCPAPQYSNPARKAKFNGNAVMMVAITEEGRAADISVAKGVPFGLNEEAVKIINQWRFRPATKEGKPVPVLTPIEINFRLH
jgi:TonB family protein